ncbi:uncharacterized protein SPPG_06949 [Spizellomyces punctatus DAOM BR117]|uniref:Velvet domain-containing protein n=1 Tax=Spizellomyces punctatus (strain DAOM BR117) TaxID=645134 RepID=A0A0L0H8U5_SPIPD|nr:uncharacterized protein SPPG_06949 [Spizellomyces punctatus DAOM BR117]KNC97960.1 hypothetical protein SPPG_06949 [Spizellomyces punctatus DAOM BR117]|eukprot:XP_016606000.1 hypothetical protein SPPG_06949 [Spizellomyces punctatus DAOM BR117]
MADSSSSSSCSDSLPPTVCREQEQPFHHYHYHHHHPPPVPAPAPPPCACVPPYPPHYQYPFHHSQQHGQLPAYLVQPPSIPYARESQQPSSVCPSFPYHHHYGHVHAHTYGHVYPHGYAPLPYHPYSHHPPHTLSSPRPHPGHSSHGDSQSGSLIESHNARDGSDRLPPKSRAQMDQSDPPSDTVPSRGPEKDDSTSSSTTVSNGHTSNQQSEKPQTEADRSDLENGSGHSPNGHDRDSASSGHAPSGHDRDSASSGGEPSGPVVTKQKGPAPNGHDTTTIASNTHAPPKHSRKLRLFIEEPASASLGPRNTSTGSSTSSPTPNPKSGNTSSGSASSSNPQRSLPTSSRSTRSSRSSRSSRSLPTNSSSGSGSNASGAESRPPTTKTRTKHRPPTTKQKPKPSSFFPIPSDDAERFAQLMVNSRLELVQQPNRARMIGFGEKDRRPIDPPPILQLLLSDPTQVSHTSAPHLIAHASLFSAHTPENQTIILNPFTSTPTPVLVGSLVSPCHVLTSPTGTPGLYFVFSDLSVRISGEFRLRFLVFDVRVPFNGRDVFSEVFRVFHPKEFPGVSGKCFDKGV